MVSIPVNALRLCGTTEERDPSLLSGDDWLFRVVEKANVGELILEVEMAPLEDGAVTVFEIAD